MWGISRRAASAIIATTILWPSVYLVFGSGRDLHAERSYNVEAVPIDLQKCTKDFAGSNATDFVALNQAADLCYKQIYNQSLINDFLIRRSRYIDQAYLDKVLLWIVVIITLSGVALSGVQVILSHKRSLAGKDNFGDSSDISIEKDKLTLRSSVVGVLILSISLAFFTIYVYGVYTIKENTDSIGSLRGVAGSSLAGGLGQPPKLAAPLSAVAPPDGPAGK